MRSQPPASLRDLARLAGVSVGTASQAMRNSHRTSRATRERIQKLAREIGFRPDPLMAAVASKRFHRDETLANSTILFVTGSEARTTDGFPRFHDELKEAITDLGYSFDWERVPDVAGFRREAKVWYHRGVRGLVLSMVPDDWLVAVDLSAFSLVMAGRFTRPVVHTVQTDGLLSLQRTIGHALADCRGPIGISLFRHSLPMYDDAWREALVRMLHAKEAPGTFTEPWLGHFEMEGEALTISAAKWFRQQPPQTICGYPYFHWALEQSGIRAGSDYERFLYFSIDARQEGQSGCVEPNAEIVQRSVEWMDSMIRHGERGVPERPVIMHIPPVWAG